MVSLRYLLSFGCRFRDAVRQIKLCGAPAD
jgi:hypothetical protein